MRCTAVWHILTRRCLGAGTAPAPAHTRQLLAAACCPSRAAIAALSALILVLRADVSTPLLHPIAWLWFARAACLLLLAIITVMANILHVYICGRTPNRAVAGVCWQRLGIVGDCGRCSHLLLLLLAARVLRVRLHLRFHEHGLMRLQQLGLVPARTASATLVWRIFHVCRSA